MLVTLTLKGALGLFPCIQVFSWLTHIWLPLRNVGFEPFRLGLFFSKFFSKSRKTYFWHRFLFFWSRKGIPFANFKQCMSIWGLFPCINSKGTSPIRETIRYLMNGPNLFLLHSSCHSSFAISFHSNHFFLGTLDQNDLNDQFLFNF